MGLYPLDTLPNQFDVVWCLWPLDGTKLKPGPVARPTLVLDVVRNEELGAGGVIVAYGTGTSTQDTPYLDGGPDLIIDTKAAWHALGLHKPTQFSMSPLRRKRLAWATEYFVPAPYRANAPIVSGSLTDDQIARVKECFVDRGLDPYWAV